jgi:hypothetical protein
MAEYAMLSPPLSDLAMTLSYETYGPELFITLSEVVLFAVFATLDGSNVHMETPMHVFLPYR